MTTREVAGYLRIKERKVYDLVRQKRIPCTRVTGKWLFPKHLIDQWVADGTEFPDRAMPSPPPALMLPKVVSPDEVRGLDELLSEHGLGTRLHVIIETNASLEAVHDIARASARIDALFFGGVDMAAELRCSNAWEPLLYARSRVVHAAARAGIDAIDVPYLDLEDPDGMAEEARLARELGFGGKGSIHPKQIPILNDVFTPSDAEIAHARRILNAFSEADTGLVVVDGKLIEKPILREMQRILSIAERLGS